MAPNFQTGDLVLTRTAHQYDVGDAVAYENPRIGQVFHRIIDKVGQEFILQGDNNYWIDSFQPTHENILGKLWFRIPSAGRIIQKLREPVNLAIFSTIFAAIALFIVSRRNKGTTDADSSKHKKREFNFPVSSLEERRDEVFFTLFVIGIAALLLGVIAFTRPLTRAKSVELMYRQSGEFSYSAEANPNVYDQETVQPGEPLFRNLTQIFDVEFTYEFSTDHPTSISGVRSLIAEVSDVDGWRRTIVMTPETEFDVHKFTFYSSLDLSEVQDMIDLFEEETGLDRKEYTLTIKPVIAFSGTMADEFFMDEFSPELRFSLDEFLVHLIIDTFNGEDPLYPASAGTVTDEIMEANTISILGYALNVSTGRWISSVIFLITVAAFIAFLWLLNRRAGIDEISRIQMLYGSRIVMVENKIIINRKQLIDVSTIEDLVRLSERDDQIILYKAMKDGHHYYVESGNFYYHYKTVDLDDNEVDEVSA